MSTVFKANREQLLDLIALAVNNSLPLGADAVKYEHIDYEPNTFEKHILTNENSKEYVDIVSYEGRSVYLRIDEVESFENYKHWIIYENVFDTRKTTCGLQLTPHKLITAANCIIENVKDLTELPDFMKTQMFIYAKMHDIQLVLKLHNMTQGQDIIDSFRNSRKASMMHYEDIDDGIMFDDATIQLLPGYGISKLCEPQIVADSFMYKPVSNFLTLFKETSNDNRINN